MAAGHNMLQAPDASYASGADSLSSNALKVMDQQVMFSHEIGMSEIDAFAYGIHLRERQAAFMFEASCSACMVSPPCLVHVHVFMYEVNLPHHVRGI